MNGLCHTSLGSLLQVSSLNHYALPKRQFSAFFSLLLLNFLNTEFKIINNLCSFSEVTALAEVLSNAGQLMSNVTTNEGFQESKNQGRKSAKEGRLRIQYGVSIHVESKKVMNGKRKSKVILS